MPETSAAAAPKIKPEDYTTRELRNAADICHEGAELTKPASDELMNIARDIQAERPDDAVRIARTARHLAGTCFHLRESEAELRSLARNVGRSYASVKACFRWLQLASSAVLIVCCLLNWFALPDHAAKIVGANLPLVIGIGAAFSVAVVILDHYVVYKRPTDR